MDENIISIKSAELMNELKSINLHAEDIIDYMLKELKIDSQDVYVILKRKSTRDVYEYNSVYKKSLISLRIMKNTNIINIFDIAGYFTEEENKMYILCMDLRNLCGRCNNIDCIRSCFLDKSIEEKYEKRKSENLEISKKIIEKRSLCKVSEQNSEYKLHRLADVNDQGKLIEVNFDRSRAKTFDNRDIICWDNGPRENNYIGVWRWKAIPDKTNKEKDLIQSEFVPQYEAIQVVLFGKERSLNRVLSQMRLGISLKVISEQIFFCIQLGQNRYLGVLCKRDNLEKKGKIYLLDKRIENLPQYTIFSNDVLRVPGNIRFYKKFDLGAPEKWRPTANHKEIVRNVFLKRTSWAFLKKQGMSRYEWKQLKTFLDEFPTDSLFQEVAENCGCSEEESKKYVNEFIQQIDKFIEGEDTETQIAKTVIADNKELETECKNIVSQQWAWNYQEEFDQAKEKFQITEAQLKSKLNEINEKKEALEKEIVEKKNILKKIEKKIELTDKKRYELENELEKYKILGNEVKDKVAQQIEEAKQNVADFISDMTFFSSSQTVQSMDVSGNSKIITAYTEGTISENEVEAVAIWQELIDILEEELSEAGIMDDFVRGMATYLYAAYLNKMPILLAGPCGESIANAFSMAMYGKTAGILNCNNEYKSDEISRILDGEDEIIMLRNPFNAAWVSSIIDLLLPAKKQYFLLIPYAEELLIEPKGILNYMMPVLTEVLVDKIPTNKFWGGKIATSFRHFVQESRTRNCYHKILKEFKLNQMAVLRRQTIMQMHHEMSRNDSVDMDYLMMLLPCAYITGKGETLIEQMEQEKRLSDNIKSSMKRFLEIRDE